MYIQWNNLQMNIDGPYWWHYITGLGKGWVPSRNKPSPESVVTSSIEEETAQKALLPWPRTTCLKGHDNIIYNTYIHISYIGIYLSIYLYIYIYIYIWHVKSTHKWQGYWSDYPGLYIFIQENPFENVVWKMATIVTQCHLRHCVYIFFRVVVSSAENNFRSYPMNLSIWHFARCWIIIT